MRGAGPERCAGLATGHRDVTSATYARISATLALMPHVRVLFALRQATAEPEYRRAMRILIATDAWRPQINGVVKTLECTIVELERRGHAVRVISPDMFWTMPMPSYPEIRLAFARKSRLRAILRDFNPDHVHIATEGPRLGHARRLPEGGSPLLHLLPYTVPGVRERAPPHSGPLELRHAPPLPRRG
jgi:hypothetical protein